MWPKLNKYMVKHCLNVAREMNNPEDHPEWGCYHHFTFILDGNKILHYATNKKGDPLIYYGYPTYGKIHSEPEAYRGARHYLKDINSFDILNIRLSKFGNLRISKPCEHCSDFLVKRGCKRAYYSVPWGFIQLNLITGQEKVIMYESE